ncbi:MAG: O-acetyl-ADP-ribose deacetylase, partial [uncultured Gemmatimonadetes bacterium]
EREGAGPDRHRRHHAGGRRRHRERRQHVAAGRRGRGRRHPPCRRARAGGGVPHAARVPHGPGQDHPRLPPPRALGDPHRGPRMAGRIARGGRSAGVRVAQFAGAGGGAGSAHHCIPIHQHRRFRVSGGACGAHRDRHDARIPARKCPSGRCNGGVFRGGGIRALLDGTCIGGL